MKLFIIGNGFDKGHGLKTGYWDFRKYLENMHPDFLCAFEDHYYIYPKMDEDAKKKQLWNELETNLANIDEDVIIEQAISIEMGLEGGDIGIEDTLYEYFTDDYKYIRLLAKHLKQWTKTIRIRDVERRTTLINEFEDAIYITFNYTAVLETVYRISAGKIIHIHGSLRNEMVCLFWVMETKRRLKELRISFRLPKENLMKKKSVSVKWWKIIIWKHIKI